MFDPKNFPDYATLEDQGTRITLLKLDGDPVMEGEKPVTALVAGVYSGRYRRAQAALRNKAVRARGNLTGDTLEARQVELDAALVIEWDIAASRQEVFAEDRFQCLRDQIVEAANNHARFFAKP